jgi:signal transduction histidine kinase/CheY-like chemotaxis protein
MESGLNVELRISPKPIIAALIFLSLSFYFGVETSSASWEQVDRAISVAVVTLLLAAVSWLFSYWHPLLGRWSTLLSLVVVVYIVDVWLEVPEALALWALPVIFATSLIDFSASVCLAFGETLLLILLRTFRPTFVPLDALGVALVGIWAALGGAYGFHYPARRLVGWLEDYFERGQRFLLEAQAQRAKLEQAVEGFASVNRQLALANTRATELRAVAEEAQRAKTAFVANVSHEFRTPLNMIIGLVDLMVESPEIYATVLSPEMRADLKVIHRNCEHLSNMINDVLDLTRMEAGRLALHKERVHLSQIIEASVETIMPLIEKKHLTMEVGIPRNLPAIYCDNIRIQQVILNLLSNATRFTDDGGITVAVIRQEQQVRVSVADTGTGIQPGDVDTIFQPFEQGRLWRGKGSSGLGLSISKRFVELHGGEMWLESEPGVGTTFYFTLPISPPMQPASRPGYTINEDWIWHKDAFKAGRLAYSKDLVKPRMVVCDREGGLYDWLTHYATEAEFIQAEGLDELVQIVDQAPVNAVILNVMDPAELRSLIEQVRNAIVGTPILGCSAPRIVERAVCAGAVGHLVKPVTRADLAASIASIEQPVRRVMVVDDDPDIRQLFGRMLRVIDTDIEVLTAPDGEEALEAMRHRSPDLVLLDIVMNNRDGWQILEMILDDPALQRVPVVFISAQDPVDRQPMSDLLAVTIDEGISLNQLLRCSQALPALLRASETVPDLTPE